MKNLNFLVTLLLNLSGMQAQNAPVFQTTIFVKDAVGNTDSIVVGYNPYFIPFDTLQYGTVPIYTPFDSILEMRVVYSELYIPDDAPLNKRLITEANAEGSCFAGASTILFIHAKYQPITLFWDRIAFDTSNCRNNAFFTPDRMAALSDPPQAWVESIGSIYACASKEDSMEYYLNPNFSFAGPEFPFWPFTIVREIEGLGMDTIVGISLDLQLTDEFSPCRLISEVNMPSVSSLQTDFSFQPNPVHEVFTLSNGRGIPIREIQVFDALGRLLNTISASTTLGERILMNVASLPPGIYYVNVLWKDGYNASRHLIKL